MKDFIKVVLLAPLMLILLVVWCIQDPSFGGDAERQRFEDGQAVHTYQIGGQEYRRIRWGDEKQKYYEKDNIQRIECPSCDAVRGQYHILFYFQGDGVSRGHCQFEECPKCGYGMKCKCNFR